MVGGVGNATTGGPRGRIVLAAGLGKTEAAIAAEMNVNRKTVRLWRERFAAQGLPGLWEIAPGRGRKATFSPKRVKALIDATLQSKPKGMTHWSCRLMAARNQLEIYCEGQSYGTARLVDAVMNAQLPPTKREDH